MPWVAIRLRPQVTSVSSGRLWSGRAHRLPAIEASHPGNPDEGLQERLVAWCASRAELVGGLSAGLVAPIAFQFAAAHFAEAGLRGAGLCVRAGQPSA